MHMQAHMCAHVVSGGRWVVDCWQIKPLNKFTSELYAYCGEIIKSSDHRMALVPYVMPLLARTLEWQMLTYRIGMTARYISTFASHKS